MRVSLCARVTRIKRHGVCIVKSKNSIRYLGSIANQPPERIPRVESDRHGIHRFRDLGSAVLPSRRDLAASPGRASENILSACTCARNSRSKLARCTPLLHDGWIRGVLRSCMSRKCRDVSPHAGRRAATSSHGCHHLMGCSRLTGVPTIR